MDDTSWLEVADERLGRDLKAVRRLTSARRGRTLTAVSRFLGPGPDEPDPEVRELLEVIGIDLGDRQAYAELASIIDRGEEVGLARAALPHVLQAYVRAVGRIAAVEAGIAADALRRVDSPDRGPVIGALLDELLPSSLRGFEFLHRAMLQDALHEVAEGLTDDAATERAAVGMVDLVRSTRYLAGASTAEVERVVDALFTAGQAATADRAAHVVKYVGDGLFVSAADVASVADATLDVVGRLEAALPLRARGGIGYGTVVQRAGDVFGMPINLAEALTKAARPGTVLLSETAAAALPPERAGRLRTRQLPKTDFGDQRVATLRPTGEDPRHVTTLEDLSAIGLEELDERAALLRRTDVKRVVSRSDLPQLLERLAAEHDVLEIDGRRVFGYESVYFDTADLRCLAEHVGGVLPRFKARTRTYVDAGRTVFEVKVKSKAGDTDKRQRPHELADAATLTPAARDLVHGVLAQAGIEPPEELDAALITSFSRFTLAHRDGGARLTVDGDVRLSRLDGGALALRPDLLIAETKSEDGNSPADRVLAELQSPEVALSKYRTGAEALLRGGSAAETTDLFVPVD